MSGTGFLHNLADIFFLYIYKRGMYFYTTTRGITEGVCSSVSLFSFISWASFNVGTYRFFSFFSMTTRDLAV